MVKSMTAFGRAVGTAGGKSFVCELKSVNGRFFDCSVKLPRAYSFLEEKILSCVRESGVSRGKLEVLVGIEITESPALSVTLDTSYAEGYIAALKQLRDTFRLADDISTVSVASNRDLFLVRKKEEDADRVWEELYPTFKEALDAYNTAREREGERLRADLTEKRRRLEALADRISSRSEECTRGYRERLEARLRKTLGDLNMEFDSQRILTECAIFADKIAIDEEIVRLRSHFKAFDEAMEGKEPVGRRLDFLIQEMGREINTSGSKSNDSEISSLVIEAKCELEKIREQVQNLE